VREDRDLDCPTSDTHAPYLLFRRHCSRTVPSGAPAGRQPRRIDHVTVPMDGRPWSKSVSIMAEIVLVRSPRAPSPPRSPPGGAPPPYEATATFLTAVSGRRFRAVLHAGTTGPRRAPDSLRGV